MPTGILDSFQLVVGLYLLYVAAKGSGQLYRFGTMSEQTQAAIRRPLRIAYAVGGVIALAEFGLCALQSAMFTVTTTESGIVVTQNFSVAALPFLSYDLLSVLSAVLTLLVVALLVVIFIWMRRKSQ